MSGYFVTFKSPWNHKNRRHPWRATSNRKWLCFPKLIKSSRLSTFAYLHYCMLYVVLMEKKYLGEFIGIGMSQLFHAHKLSGPIIKYIHTCIQQKWLIICKAMNRKSSSGWHIAQLFHLLWKHPSKLWLKIMHTNLWKHILFTVLKTKGPLELNPY